MKLTTSKVWSNHQGQSAGPFREVNMVIQDSRLGLGIVAILMIATIKAILLIQKILTIQGNFRHFPSNPINHNCCSGHFSPLAISTFSSISYVLVIKSNFFFDHFRHWHHFIHYIHFHNTSIVTKTSAISEANTVSFKLKMKIIQYIFSHSCLFHKSNHLIRFNYVSYVKHFSHWNYL